MDEVACDIALRHPTPQSISEMAGELSFHRAHLLSQGINGTAYLYIFPPASDEEIDHLLDVMGVPARRRRYWNDKKSFLKRHLYIPNDSSGKAHYAVVGGRN